MIIDYVGNYFHSKRTNYYFSEETHSLIKSIQDEMKSFILVKFKAECGQTVVIMYRYTDIIHIVKKLM